jgi:predicted KAP-like P-loop ATPase
MNRIHKLHNVLPKKVRLLKGGKVASLKKGFVSIVSEQKNIAGSLTFSCAL